MSVEHTRPRLGFTLIELLVAIAIIGLVMALTLSAVQRVRASAARAHCQNNLRQIGLAAQNYHGVAHRFPIGVTGHAQAGEPYPYMTWMTRLLPYLEQGAIWDDTTRAFQAQPDFQVDPAHAHRARPMPAFSCPLDGRLASPALFPLASGEEKGYALTSYLGVAGVNRVRSDGLLYLNEAHRMADIGDGASSTLFVGERPPSFDRRFGWWYAGEGFQKDGDADSVLGVRARCRRSNYCDDCGDEPARFQVGQLERKCDFLHFWSPHPGGAHFLFADGSVRFLRYSADPIMPALSTRAGGESVSLD